MMPEIQFKVHIKKSKDNQYYSTLVGHNGETVYVQETRKSKSALKKFVVKWFPDALVIDETLKGFKKK